MVPSGWLSTDLPWTRARRRAGADWTGAQGGVPTGSMEAWFYLRYSRRVKGEVNSLLIKSVGGRKFGGVTKPSPHIQDVGKTQRAIER